jgi:enolase
MSEKPPIPPEPSGNNENINSPIIERIKTESGDPEIVENIEKYKECFNSCILKINQSGSFTALLNSLKFCKQNGINTIISQRSGETDSTILAHLAVGLGADYMKAGAPARERIVKYNELLRISK